MQGNQKISFKRRLVHEREQMILSVSRRMFAENGFHGTNLSDVANEVGIARGTIYLHFETKEELLAAIIQQADEQLLEVLSQVIRPDDSPLEKLRKILKEYLMACHTYEDLIGVMSYELRLAAGNKLYGDRNGRSVTDLVEETVEEAKSKGLIDAEINTVIASRSFFSIILKRSESAKLLITLRLRDVLS